MSREVRRVPADWEHPRDEDGDLIPLLTGWTRNKDDFESFKAKNSLTDKEAQVQLGWIPIRENHMPEWSEEEATHLQMYESTTEGTPMSPVMATAEELADWLFENEAYAGADGTATREQWLAMIRRGYASTGLLSINRNTGEVTVTSGVVAGV